VEHVRLQGPLRSSRVFGERASVFADLDSRTPGVFVASHRAFITPAPPKAYFSKLLIPLRHGQAFQPEAIADRLSKWIPSRSCVALPGEFAQRGEVLDVFMPGDQQVIRSVQLYTIEKITRSMQFAIVPELIESCVVRPLKKSYGSPPSLPLSAKYAKITRLSRKEWAPGESLAEAGECEVKSLDVQRFSKAAFRREYFSDSMVLLMANSERLESHEESTRKEYAGMYRPRCAIPRFSAGKLREYISGALGGVDRIVRSFALNDQKQTTDRVGVECALLFGNIRYSARTWPFRKDKEADLYRRVHRHTSDRIATLHQESAATLL